MITKEIRMWLDKVDRGQYSYEDIMYEFANYMRFLSKDEALLIKRKIEERGHS